MTTPTTDLDPVVARKPKRIQRKRTKGWRMPAGAVYVGRPSRWGNPFRLDYGGIQPLDRSDLVVQFRAAMRAVGQYRVVGTDEQFRDALVRETATSRAPVAWTEHIALRDWDRFAWIVDHVEELRGKDLACWCPLDEPCHADVLLELANA